MSAATSTRPPVGPVKRLLVTKFGALKCGGRRGHDYRPLTFRGRMFLRCANCPAETEGFEVYQPLRGERGGGGHQSMKARDCGLGDEVRDTITGYAGVVVAKTEWLNGCVRVTVQTRELKDGKPVDSCVFDVEQLAVVTASQIEMPQERTGGDRPTTGARQ